MKQTKPSKAKLPAFQIREIAVAAQVDPRTVERALGIVTGTVRPMVIQRVRAALEARGWGHLIPAPVQP